MRGVFISPQKNRYYKAISGALACILSVSLILTPSAAQAQTVLNLPIPGTMIVPSPAFVPILLKGMTVHPEDPFQFDFIIDSGNTEFTPNQVKVESEKLVKYFLASMTIPKDDLWVNLSPYESDRIIPEQLGKTELGRDMLAQDYILKQLTASLMYPEEELGKKFWARIYERAEKEFGTSAIPVNTFNKVWILPEEATVYEHENTVYIVDAHLKVMLDSDYLAMENANVGAQNFVPIQDDLSISSQIIKEIILPEIEREVNEGKHFAPLRQIYHSLILAKWYKETVKNSLLNQVYADKNKIAGIDMDDKTLKDQIYAQYMDAYKKGVFNYIREDYDRLSNEIIPRKYFSGGLDKLANVDIKRTSSPITGKGILGKGFILLVALSAATLIPSQLDIDTGSKKPPTIQSEFVAPKKMSLEDVRISFTTSEKQQWLAYFDSEDKFTQKAAIIIWRLADKTSPDALPKLIEKLKSDDKEIDALAMESIKLYGNAARNVVLKGFISNNIRRSDFHKIYKYLDLRKNDLDVLFDQFDHIDYLNAIIDTKVYLEIAKSVIAKDADLAKFFLYRLINAIKNPEGYTDDIILNYSFMMKELGRVSMEQALEVIKRGSFEERLTAVMVASSLSPDFKDLFPELEKVILLPINDDMRDLLEPIRENFNKKLEARAEREKFEEDTREFRELRESMRKTQIGIYGNKRPSKPKIMEFSLKKIVNFFASGLVKTDEEIRSLSQSALTMIGEPAIPQLIQTFRYKSRRNSFSFIRSYPSTNSKLSKASEELLSSKGPVIIPYLVDAIYSTDNESIFDKSLNLLASFDYQPKTDKEKAAYYFARESSRKYGYKYIAGGNFKEFSSIGAGAIPFLKRIAKVKGFDNFFIEAAGSLGPVAVSLLPDFQNLLEEENFLIDKGDIYSSVAKIGGQEAFEMLMEGLKDDALDSVDKSYIIWGLANSKEFSDKKVFETLRPIFKSPNIVDRISVYAAFANDRFFQEPGVDQIFLDGLDDSDNLLKYNVINFLGSKGEKATFALEKLKEIIDDPNTEENFGGFNLRHAAEKAYRNISKSTEKSTQTNAKSSSPASIEKFENEVRSITGFDLMKGEFVEKEEEFLEEILHVIIEKWDALGMKNAVIFNLEDRIKPLFELAERRKNWDVAANIIFFLNETDKQGELVNVLDKLETKTKFAKTHWENLMESEELNRAFRFLRWMSYPENEWSMTHLMYFQIDDYWADMIKKLKNIKSPVAYDFLEEAKSIISERKWKDHTTGPTNKLRNAFQEAYGEEWKRTSSSPVSVSQKEAEEYQQEVKALFMSYAENTRKDFDPRLTDPQIVSGKIKGNNGNSVSLFHHIPVNSDEKIVEVYANTQQIVHNVLGEDTKVIDMDLNEIHVTIVNDDVAPREELTLTLDQLRDEVIEDAKGVKPFEITLVGPRLIGNGVVVMEYTTSAPEFLHLRKRASKRFNERKKEKVLSENNRGSAPKIIHSTVSVIRDHAVSQEKLSTLFERLNEYRRNMPPINFEVRKLMATYFQESNRRFIDFRAIPLNVQAADNETAPSSSPSSSDADASSPVAVAQKILNYYNSQSLSSEQIAGKLQERKLVFKPKIDALQPLIITSERIILKNGEAGTRHTFEVISDNNTIERIGDPIEESGENVEKHPNLILVAFLTKNSLKKFKKALGISDDLIPPTKRPLFGRPLTRKQARVVLDDLHNYKAGSIKMAIKRIGIYEQDNDDIRRLLQIFFMNNIELKKEAAIALGDMLRVKGTSMISLSNMKSKSGVRLMQKHNGQYEILLSVQKALWQERYQEETEEHEKYKSALIKAENLIFGRIASISEQDEDDLFDNEYYTAEEAFKNEKSISSSPIEIIDLVGEAPIPSVKEISLPGGKVFSDHLQNNEVQGFISNLTEDSEMLIIGGSVHDMDHLLDLFPKVKITIVNLSDTLLKPIVEKYSRNPSIRERLKLYVADASKLKSYQVMGEEIFKDQSYDLIYAFGVDRTAYHDMEEGLKVLKKVANEEVRILKPGGLIYHPYPAPSSTNIKAARAVFDHPQAREIMRKIEEVKQSDPKSANKLMKEIYKLPHVSKILGGLGIGTTFKMDDSRMYYSDALDKGLLEPILSDMGYFRKPVSEAIVLPVDQPKNIRLGATGEGGVMVFAPGKDQLTTSSPVSEDLGGIDMNQIDVDRQGSGVSIQFDPIDVQEIMNMDFDGLTPVIINLTPLPSVLPLLGLAPQREEEEFKISKK